MFILDCGSKYSIENGHVNFAGMKTTYGEKVHVNCDVGHHLVGNGYIECKADGTWSNATACHIQGKR